MLQTWGEANDITRLLRSRTLGWTYLLQQFRASNATVGIMAVSYTHLDVYKRQLQDYAASPVSGGRPSIAGVSRNEKTT